MKDKNILLKEIKVRLSKKKIKVIDFVKWSENLKKLAVEGKPDIKKWQLEVSPDEKQKI